jgi:hypothetical protein
MLLKEALFWVGVPLLGFGMLLAFEADKAVWGVVVALAGLAMCVYSVVSDSHR